MESVCSHVAYAAATAGIAGIGPPGSLFLPLGFNPSGEPSLRILHDNAPDRSQIPRLHELASLGHHRVSRVMLCQTEYLAGLFQFPP